MTKHLAMCYTYAQYNQLLGKAIERHINKFNTKKSQGNS